MCLCVCVCVSEGQRECASRPAAAPQTSRSPRRGKQSGSGGGAEGRRAGEGRAGELREGLRDRLPFFN